MQEAFLQAARSWGDGGVVSSGGVGTGRAVLGGRVEQQQVLGVHGIGQSKTSQRRLAFDWQRALERGINRLGSALPAAHPTLSTLSVNVPHWSSLIREETDTLSSADTFAFDNVTFTAEEEDFVARALDDLLTAEDRAYAEQLDPTTLGLPRIPGHVTRTAMAYDRSHPGGQVTALIEHLREVHLYLTDGDLARRVRGCVLEAASDLTTVVIGHSLGSVIAFDLLRLGELAAPGTVGAGVRMLVTCGSPLAIPTVRRAMGLQDQELMTPPGIRWLNVFDPGDAVTGGAGLALAAPNVIDAKVANGLIQPHAATRYLRTVPVAQAVTGGWS